MVTLCASHRGRHLTFDVELEGCSHPPSERRDEQRRKQAVGTKYDTDVNQRKVKDVNRGHRQE